MNNNNPKEGDIVEVNLDDTGFEFIPMRAQVMALLDTQFTARYMDGTDTTTFRFYRDGGHSWRYAQ